MHRQIDGRDRNIVEAIGMMARSTEEMHMQIIRIALAGFGAERVFNRAGAIVDTMYQFVFLKCFECAKQCNPVGFLELLFEFGETYCRGLFGKHLQHQFAHSGWLDVAVV